VQLAALQVHVAPLEPDQLPLPQPRLERHQEQRSPFRLGGVAQALEENNLAICF
jgi:hypothetical protein